MRFGSTLASAGDINGDGYADLIVGDGMLNQWIWAGQTYGATVFYGGTGGPQLLNGCASSKNLQGNSSPACTTNVTQSCVPHGAGVPGTCQILTLPAAAGVAPYNLLGVDVAGANAEGNSLPFGGQDVNGDGFADFIVGWPVNYTPGASSNRADVYYGSATGVTPAFSGARAARLGPV